MKRKLLAAGAALSVALAALPWGAVLVFSDGEEVRRLHFSYFDPTPFGYANFAPLLTAVACTVLLIDTLLCLWKKTGFGLPQVLAGAAFVLSLLPAFRGAAYLSVLGILISLVLLCEVIVSFLPLPDKTEPEKKKRKGRRKKK